VSGSYTNRLFEPLQITDPTASANPLTQGTPSQGAALASTGQMIADWSAEQTRKSVEMGLWDPETGLPTEAGVLDAARQYANAMLLGSTRPKTMNPIRAYHGSLADFTTFDPKLTGTGATAEVGRYAKPTEFPQAMYLTTERGHAEDYGTPMAFDITGKVKNYNAVSDLKSWAKDMGYKTPQAMIDDYYGGSVYEALNADQYFAEKIEEATASGHKAISVDFGDLVSRRGDTGKQRLGKVFLVADPTMLRRVTE
jgi:hypothetical protein